METLSGKELYKLKKQKKENLLKATGKISKYLLYGAIGAAAISGLGWFIFSRPHLPPISLEGHIEEAPPARINEQPIPDSI